MQRQGDKSSKRSELVAVASAMIGGDMNLIEGVRKIATLCHHVDDPDGEVFIPIRAIESETDHFPLGAARAQCSAEYLKRADDEMERYLADARGDVVVACQEIVRNIFACAAEADLGSGGAGTAT